MINLLRKPVPLFATAVASDARRSLASDLKAVTANLIECRACQSRWFGIACAIDTLHRFLAPRMITTVVATIAIWVTIAVLI